MLSLDKYPDWSIFYEREVPFDVEILSPALEMAMILQRYRADVDSIKKENEANIDEERAALAQQAVFVAQLAMALEQYESSLVQASLTRVHRHFRILKDQMVDSLKNRGLEIIVPKGQTFDDVADLVNVEGWRHHENFTSEVVAEVLEPIVKYHGSTIRLGRVIMGAPPENKDTGKEKEK